MNLVEECMYRYNLNSFVIRKDSGTRKRDREGQFFATAGKFAEELINMYHRHLPLVVTVFCQNELWLVT